jgi:hypothetical protein
MLDKNETESVSASTRDVYYNIGEFLGSYVIPITAGFGISTNILLQGTLFSLKRQKRFYDLVQGKSVAELLFCLLFIYFKNNTTDPTYTNSLRTTYDSYGNQFYAAYIFPYMKFFYEFGFCFEIFISYERLCILYNRKAFLARIPVKFIFFFSLMVFLVVRMIPYYLILQINYIRALDKYTITFQDNWLYTYLYWYRFSLGILLYVFGSITLTLMNILITKKYLHFIKTFSVYRRSQQKSTTSIIMVTNVYFILYNLFNALVVLIETYKLLANQNITFLLRNLVYVLILLSYSISLFICFLFDRFILVSFISNFKMNYI